MKPELLIKILQDAFKERLEKLESNELGLTNDLNTCQIIIDQIMSEPQILENKPNKLEIAFSPSNNAIEKKILSPTSNKLFKRNTISNSKLKQEKSIKIRSTNNDTSINKSNLNTKTNEFESKKENSNRTKSIKLIRNNSEIGKLIKPLKNGKDLRKSFDESN